MNQGIAQVHMYMSEKEFTDLKNGDVAFGYTKGFTEYNIHVSVPVDSVINILDVSEDGEVHYEYEVQLEGGGL
ncbi:hypothetical protein Goe20_01860 [Bacillus phage vB_BsuM-Goe20]|nr:hypothetical protein Goe20_01860 [Bacillus phage vB_BsuM-Goe20]